MSSNGLARADLGAVAIGFDAPAESETEMSATDRRALEDGLVETFLDRAQQGGFRRSADGRVVYDYDPLERAAADRKTELNPDNLPPLTMREFAYYCMAPVNSNLNLVARAHTHKPTMPNVVQRLTSHPPDSRFPIVGVVWD